MPSAVLGGKKYRYDVLVRTEDKEPNTVHIVQPCHNAVELTELSVRCIKTFTDSPYVLWLVDNRSDRMTRERISQMEGVNIIFNHTGIDSWLRRWNRIPYGGSLANAVALELGAREISGNLMFVMHNDCVPCKKGWLGYLRSKMNDKVRIVGVRQDTSRVNAMHQSGFLFDLALYRKLGLSFMHHMPEYDVGDRVTTGLLENGYEYYLCRNAYNHPDTAELLLKDSYPPVLRDYIFDQAFDDAGEPFYLHLGRGTLVDREARLKERRLSKDDWISVIEDYFLKRSGAPKKKGGS